MFGHDECTSVCALLKHLPLEEEAKKKQAENKRRKHKRPALMKLIESIDYLIKEPHQQLIIHSPSAVGCSYKWVEEGGGEWVSPHQSDPKASETPQHMWRTLETSPEGE